MESGLEQKAFFITLGGPQPYFQEKLQQLLCHRVVISTEAKRSGGISVLTPLPGNVFRPERSGEICSFPFSLA
jgi:hypothetical protein